MTGTGRRGGPEDQAEKVQTHRGRALLQAQSRPSEDEGSNPLGRPIRTEAREPAEDVPGRSLHRHDQQHLRKSRERHGHVEEELPLQLLPKRRGGERNPHDRPENRKAQLPRPREVHGVRPREGRDDASVRDRHPSALVGDASEGAERHEGASRGPRRTPEEEIKNCKTGQKSAVFASIRQAFYHRVISEGNEGKLRTLRNQHTHTLSGFEDREVCHQKEK